MLFSRRHRKRKIRKSANTYNRRCCPTLSNSPKNAKKAPNSRAKK